MSVSRPLLALLAALLLLAPAGAEAKTHSPTKPHRKHAAKRMRAPGGDRDRDGLSNRYEKLARTDPRVPDTDGDGVLDAFEDRDRDGVDNHTEQLARTRPDRRDSDGDGTADGAEDPDHDGLPNSGESLAQLNPRKPDTDRDGVLDGDENAGVVSAVGDGSVTVALAKGGDLTASWDEDTDVICADDDDTASDDLDADDDSVLDDDDVDADDDSADADDDLSADDDAADDDDGDDDDRDESLDDGGCAPQVGDVVYEADVDEDGLLLSLDLLGA